MIPRSRMTTLNASSRRSPSTRRTWRPGRRRTPSPTRRSAAAPSWSPSPRRRRASRAGNPSSPSEAMARRRRNRQPRGSLQPRRTTGRREGPRRARNDHDHPSFDNPSLLIKLASISQVYYPPELRNYSLSISPATLTHLHYALI